MFLLESLPESSFSASSSLNRTTIPYFSTQKNPDATGWFAWESNENQWIQVDFGKPKLIRRMILSPAKGDTQSYVESFDLFGSLDGEELTLVEEYWDDPKEQETHYYFEKILLSRYVRLAPTKWSNHIAVRWEFIEAIGKLLYCLTLLLRCRVPNIQQVYFYLGSPPSCVKA